MKILIIGNGFIGASLAKYLKLSDVKVDVALIRQSKLSIKENLPIVPLRSKQLLKNFFSSYDVIVDTVGTSALQSYKDPLNALSVNGLLTAKLVSSAAAAKVKRFIYLSSVHVYGDSLEGKINELSPTKNLHPYALSHLVGENVVLSPYYKKDMEGIVLRLSNLFGIPAYIESNCWSLLTNDISKQCVLNGSIKLNSSGLQKRDFLSISEGCRAIKEMINCDIKFKNKEGAIFNISLGKSKTVMQMAELVRDRCKKVLNFEPEIQVGASATKEIDQDLIIQTDKLEAIGIKLIDDSSYIIDNLLIYCKENFK